MVSKASFPSNGPFPCDLELFRQITPKQIRQILKTSFFCVLLSTDRLGSSLVDENSNHASRVGKVSLSKESFTTVSNFYVWLFGAGELVVCPMKYKSVQREQSDVELQLDATDFKLQLWQETLSYQWVATYKSYNPQTRILDTI